MRENFILKGFQYLKKGQKKCILKIYSLKYYYLEKNNNIRTYSYFREILQALNCISILYMLDLCQCSLKNK